MPAEVRAYLFYVLQGYFAVPSKGVGKETRPSVLSLSIFLLILYIMSLLWVMVGLTIVAVALLILNFLLFKKTRAERQRRDKEVSADKESAFQRNCVTYHLSVREIEILRLILAGHTYRTAADILFISEKTVDAHLRSIYAKTGVKNKVELVVRFYS